MGDAVTEEPRYLLEEAHALCRDVYFRDVIWRHCAFRSGTSSPDRLDMAIHSGDQMLWHSLLHHRDANAAFAQYFNVALQQHHAAQQVLRAIFSAPGDGFRFLDFACGYGRLLRFLVHSLPPSNIWAAEIQADALDFVCSRFGVHRIASQADPAAFRPSVRFHMIWVASLFSHLPDSLFRSWIARLLDCLEEGGVLCFSVHDACLLPAGLTLDEQGMLFLPVSENADLDTRIYGTTYVSEAYVAAVLADAGRDAYLRIPRGLAHEQDLYVVAASPGRDLSPLYAFRHGPWGWVDEREVRRCGQVYLRGWAASIDDGPLPHVDILINDRHFECPTGLRREDVGRVFADPRLDHSGWEFSHALDRGSEPIRVVVSANTARDEQALLYAGLLQSSREDGDGKQG